MNNQLYCKKLDERIYIVIDNDYQIIVSTDNISDFTNAYFNHLQPIEAISKFCDWYVFYIDYEPALLFTKEWRKSQTFKEDTFLKIMKENKSFQDFWIFNTTISSNIRDLANEVPEDM